MRVTRQRVLFATSIVLAAITVILFVPSLGAAYHLLQIPCTGHSCWDHQVAPSAARALVRHGVSLQAYAAYYTGMSAVLAAGWLVVALILLLRRSSDPMTLFAAVTFVGFGCCLMGVFNAPAVEGYAWAPIAQLLNNVGFLSLFILLYVFPNGRFVPLWTLAVAVLLILILAGGSLFPGSVVDPNAWPDPFAAIPFASLVSSSIYAQVYRYRKVSGPVERQQTKWVVLGTVAALGLFAAIVAAQSAIPGFLAEGTIGWMITLAIAVSTFLLIPASVAVAIFRYHLWEIDVLINRTLVYGSLTLSLAALYIGGVVVMQALIRALTGQTSELVVALVTLIIAGLFNPWRRRLQSFIDRRFYRRKYDATQTLAILSTHLRDEVDLEHLSGELMSVVQGTVQPSTVAIWLREPEGQG